jgi:hypothetical protein
MTQSTRFSCLLAALLLPAAALAQPADVKAADPNFADLGIGQALASPGGTVSMSPPVAVAPAEDIVNQSVAAETVDGLVVVVTIDGADIHFESATPARLPNRKPSRQSPAARQGGTVKATAFADGQAVASVEVADPGADQPAPGGAAAGRNARGGPHRHRGGCDRRTRHAGGRGGLRALVPRQSGQPVVSPTKGRAHR